MRATRNKGTKKEVPPRNANSGAEIMVTRSPQQVIQSMIQDCCFSEADVACKICEALKAKLARLKDGHYKTPLEENEFLMEQQENQTLSSLFPLCERINKNDPKSRSISVSSPEFQQQIGDAKSVAGGKAATESGASQEELQAGAHRDSQKIDDAPDSQDKNISLSYGLHDLIRDIEQSPNHRIVYDGLSQTQLRSLFAQITCKQTLIKEEKVENSLTTMRLVRIEQELNDLMVKDEVAKEIVETNSRSARGAVVSKKSNHETG